jgi:hypothetical protein
MSAAGFNGQRRRARFGRNGDSKEAGRLECGVKGGRGRSWELLYRLVWRREAVPRRPWPSMAGLERELKGGGELRG